MPLLRGAAVRIGPYEITGGAAHQELMRGIAPADCAGIDGVDSVHITPDGGTYAYSCVQTLSDLHLVEGLK